MRYPHRLLTLSLVATFALLALPSWSPAQDTRSNRRTFSSMINVDALINNYARLLARKYDLTEEQDAYTREFLRAKAHQYMDKHQDQLFGLMDHMFAVRGGDDITQDEMVRWGEEAYPLFEEARVLIEDGNMEWREILNDEQKAIHDADLELMYMSFDRTQEHLEKIVSGEMTTDEFRRGPRPPTQPNKAGTMRPTPRRGSGSEAQPGKRAPGKPSTAESREDQIAKAKEKLEKLRRDRLQGSSKSPTNKEPRRRTNTSNKAPTKVSKDFEGEWEKYTREFIEKYDLTDAQTQRAKLILKECQERAASYMATRKTQIESLDKKIKDATGDKAQAKRVEQLTQQRDRLLAPIAKIFDDSLKPRLDRLLTPKQKQEGDKKPTPRTRTPTPRKTEPTPEKKDEEG
jgi:type II secretory pathway pseudopilin PulG